MTLALVDEPVVDLGGVQAGGVAHLLLDFLRGVGPGDVGVPPGLEDRNGRGRQLALLLLALELLRELQDLASVPETRLKRGVNQLRTIMYLISVLVF